MLEKDFDKWNSLKKNMNNKDVSIYVKERQVWWASLGLNVGHEIDGKNSLFERPVLIYKKLSRFTFLVIPISSSFGNEEYYYPFTHNGDTQYIVLNQCKVLDIKRLTRKLSTVDKVIFDGVKNAFTEKYGSRLAAASSDPEGLDKSIISQLEKKSNINSQHIKKSRLSIVATPIGNLEDITLRSIRTLKECDLIACENTSDAQRLLKQYDIETPTTVYFANSRLSHADKILSILKEGGHVSLISDAGTPAVSDPGVLLIQKVRDTLPECIIETIPGASALVAALSVSGFIGNQFTFFGFVPHKKGRETLVRNIVQHNYIAIVYESVHRVEKFLEALQNEMESAGIEKQLLIARELTKLHEQLVRGTAREVCTYFKENPDKIKGEFVILIDGTH